jgi:hypothetical protein
VAFLRGGTDDDIDIVAARDEVRRRRDSHVGPSSTGILDLSQKKLCVPRVGVRQRAKHDSCSINSTIELLHGRVGGAELEKLE